MAQRMATKDIQCQEDGIRSNDDISEAHAPPIAELERIEEMNPMEDDKYGYEVEEIAM